MMWRFSANLGCRSEMCGSLEIQDAKIAKNSPSGHNHTTLSGCIVATKAHIDNQKKNLNSNISPICPHSMVNFGPLTAEIGLPVWGTPANSMCFASCLRYCSDVTHRRPTKLCTMLGRLLGWYTIYYIHFRGFLPPDGILSGIKFTLCPSLAFSYIGSVTARHSSSGRQPNFAASFKEWNYGIFAEGATYIRLGGHHVGHRPHSSVFLILSRGSRMVQKRFH